MTKAQIAASLLKQFLSLNALNTVAQNAGTFADRKVGVHRDGDLYICTARVDGTHRDVESIYQTAISHPAYESAGPMVIVGEYQDRATAELGHDAWIQRMQNPPATLRDVDSSMLAYVSDIVHGTEWRTVERSDDFASEDDTASDIEAA